MLKNLRPTNKLLIHKRNLLYLKKEYFEFREIIWNRWFTTINDKM